MTAYVFSKAIWQHMNYFIHPQLDWHTIQTLKWWWDHITKIKFIKQYPLRNSLPVHLTNMHKHGCWSWQWKAMTSLIDSIPPCCVQFLCATVTLFSSIFCFSEKLPSLFLRSFRITTWRKNTSGEKIIGLVQQQFIFLFQEMSIRRNTSETAAYCFTVGVSVNQLINRIS